MRADRSFSLVRLWGDLSLDVVLGAVAGSALAGRLLAVEMPGVWWIGLALAAWSIYTADHLMDAKRLGEAARTSRHRLHHEWFRPLALAWVVVTMSCLSWVAFLLPRELTSLGYAVGALVLGHLALVRWVGGRVSIWLHKELAVGTLYAGGVWSGPLLLAGAAPSAEVWLCALQFAALVFANLFIFGAYETEVDREHQSSSFSRLLGETAARRLALAFCAFVIISIPLALRGGDPRDLCLATQVLFAAMALLLGCLALAPERFAKGERYRWIGDGVFLMPGLVVILS